MTRRGTLLFIAVLGTCFGLGTGLRAPDQQGAFFAVRVYVDSGDDALAAYQAEVVISDGGASLVGVEGGTVDAFTRAPYYDPRALHDGAGRIVIADFIRGSTPAPKGDVHVATLHFYGSIDAAMNAALQASGSSADNRIRAAVRLEPIERSVP